MRPRSPGLSSTAVHFGSRKIQPADETRPSRAAAIAGLVLMSLACVAGAGYLARDFVTALDEHARQQQQFAVEERQIQLPARLEASGR